MIDSIEPGRIIPAQQQFRREIMMTEPAEDMTYVRCTDKACCQAVSGFVDHLHQISRDPLAMCWQSQIKGQDQNVRSVSEQPRVLTA